MTEPLYSGEAICKRWGDSSSGGRTVTLQLEDGGPHPFRGYEGERFAIVVVPIGNDEKPMKKNCSGREIGRQNSGHAGLATSQEVALGPSREAPSVIVDAAATKPKKRWHEMPPSQRAALLVKDAEFIRYIDSTTFVEIYDEETADKWLKHFCGIASKSELRPGTLAHAKFVDIEGNFQAWRQAKQHGAA